MEGMSTMSGQLLGRDIRGVSQGYQRVWYQGVEGGRVGWRGRVEGWGGVEGWLEGWLEGWGGGVGWRG